MKNSKEFTSSPFIIAPNLLTQNNFGIVIYDLDKEILLDCNDKYLELVDSLYREKKSLLGKTIEEVYTKDKIEEIYKCFYRMIKGEEIVFLKEIRYEHSTRGETYCDKAYVPIYVEEKIKYVIHTIIDVTEKVKNILLEEKEKYELKTIISNAADGLFTVDREYNYTLLNKIVEEMFSYIEGTKKVDDSLIQSTYMDIDDNPIHSFKPLYDRILNGEKVQDFRFKAIHPSATFYLSLSGIPLYDNNGQIEKAILSIRNITKQVEKDRLLHYKDIKSNTLFNNVSDCIIICDHEGECIRSNILCTKSPILSALGFTTDDKKNILVFDEEDNIIPPEKLPPIRVAQGEILSGYRLSIQLNNILYFYEINASPTYDHEGNFTAGILICRDISDRIKNEENMFLKRQYDLLNTTIINLDLPCIMVSYPNFEISYLNSKAYADLAIFDMKVNFSNPVVGRNFFEVYKYCDDEKCEVIAKVQAVVEYGRKYYYHYRNNPYGKNLFFKIMFQPLYSNNKRVSYIAIFPMDISDEIKAQKQLTEALNKQDEVFANISHELKTPLNVIYTANQMISTQIKNSSLGIEKKEEFLKYNNIIKQNCYRFTKIINNITDMQNIDSGFISVQLRNENIVEVVEGIVQSVVEYSKDKGVEILFDTDTEEKIIACDSVKMVRVLLNLISNAIKFSDPGSQIFVHLYDKGDFVEILVIDQGIGIEEKYLDSIFMKFHQIDKSLTRNAEGSGIGLPLVKSIVGLHGGTIDVSSKVGEGSTFKVILPVKCVEEEEDAPSNNDDKIEQIKIEFSDIYHL